MYEEVSDYDLKVDFWVSHCTEEKNPDQMYLYKNRVIDFLSYAAGYVIMYFGMADLLLYHVAKNSVDDRESYDTAVQWLSDISESFTKRRMPLFLVGVLPLYTPDELFTKGGSEANSITGKSSTSISNRSRMSIHSTHSVGGGGALSSQSRRGSTRGSTYMKLIGQEEDFRESRYFEEVKKVKRLVNLEEAQKTAEQYRASYIEFCLEEEKEPLRPIIELLVNQLPPKENLVAGLEMAVPMHFKLYRLVAEQTKRKASFVASLSMLNQSSQRRMTFWPGNTDPVNAGTGALLGVQLEHSTTNMDKSLMDKSNPNLARDRYLDTYNKYINESEELTEVCDWL